MNEDPEIIEARVDEVVTPGHKPGKKPKDRSTKQKTRREEQQDPFQMPKMGLRARITMKVMQLMANPKTARFFKKSWWPLWVVVGIIGFTLTLIGGAIFLIWRLLILISRPYIELFTKDKTRS